MLYSRKLKKRYPTIYIFKSLVNICQELLHRIFSNNRKYTTKLKTFCWLKTLFNNNVPGTSILVYYKHVFNEIKNIL